MTHTQAVDTLAAERYLLDEMSELERQAFEEHYFSCRECADDVRSGGAMRAGVKAGLLNDEPAVRPAPRDENVRRPDFTAGRKSAARWPRFEVVLPWAVAATLALVVGSQQLGPGGPTLQTQALSPVTLRPATRGAEPTVQLRAEASAVTFAVELNPGTAVELAYDLRTADDRRVDSGRVPAPASGNPLLLLMSTASLEADARYTLAIRDAATGELLGEYRFSATRG
jgi:hypothetical protein